MRIGNAGAAVLAALAAGALVVAWAGEDDDEGDEATLKALPSARHTLAEAVRAASKDGAVALSAKFEIGDEGADKGRLMLSVYSAKKGLADDAWEAGLTEIAGVATQETWTTGDSPRKEGDDLAHAAQQETLLALTDVTLADVVARAEKAGRGTVVSARPGLHGRKPVFAVRLAEAGKVSEIEYDLRTGEPVAGKPK